jgi:hypothetical protein
VTEIRRSASITSRGTLFGLAGEAFSGKVGDHEARILPFVEDLGFAQPARAAPTLARAILKVLKSAGKAAGSLRFLSPVKLSEAFAQAGAQPFVARQSQTVIDSVLLAPPHNLLAGEPTVGPHNNAHLAPKSMQPIIAKTPRQPLYESHPRVDPSQKHRSSVAAQVTSGKIPRHFAASMDLKFENLPLTLCHSEVPLVDCLEHQQP